MKLTGTLVLLLAPALVALALPGPQDRKLGHDDTPYLPGGKWRVHDGTRPQPPIVTPGVGARPPSDAIVLFDGTNMDGWKSSKGNDRKWKLVEGGAMEVTNAGAMETLEQFGDVQLHVEWATPAKVEKDDQLRGNSGILMMGKYEVQILDSYQNPTYPDGQAGALYGQHPPLVNASRGPGEWQSFDIIFTAPRFEGDKLVAPATATVLHNGVLLHLRREFIGATTYKRVAKYRPHPPQGPIKLQDHWFPVRFRNIWARRLQ